MRQTFCPLCGAGPSQRAVQRAYRRLYFRLRSRWRRTVSRVDALDGLAAETITADYRAHVDHLKAIKVAARRGRMRPKAAMRRMAAVVERQR